jgi:Hemerythrin HHE cation binding domain
MDDATRLQQILAEHATIRQTIFRIELELDRFRTRADEVRGKDWALPGLMRSFRTHLKRHFELEEGGGLLGDAAAYFDDEAQRRVEELVGEHRQLEHAIDHICDELDERIDPGETVQRCFDVEIRKLIGHLSRHEFTETALLNKVLGKTPDEGQHAPSKGA